MAGQALGLLCSPSAALADVSLGRVAYLTVLVWELLEHAHLVVRDGLAGPARNRSCNRPTQLDSCKRLNQH